jgi:transcriptional regulator with XRE-family HTH domain
MTDGHGPTTIRRRLRAELRKLRLERSLSVDQVTDIVEWSTSKLVRIEGGQVGISVSDLNALLDVYQVADTAQTARLRELARASRKRAWWSGYQKFLPQPYLEFIGAEADATKIQQYHPTLVPGLLQIPDYATAIIRATELSRTPDDVVHARAEVRKKRQENVLAREHPPEYTALIDEAVLRRPVGGTQTMRDQLSHLLTLVERKTITLVVIPFHVGPHAGLLGAFALMDYDDPADDEVVYLETAQGNFTFADPAIVDGYRTTAKRLMEIGLGGDEMVEFVTRVRSELD